MQTYTVKEASEVFKVTTDTVYRWVREGKVKTAHLGRSVRIPKSELDSMMGIQSN